MKAQDVTKGMQVMTGTKGFRKVLSVQHMHRSVVLILEGGLYMTPLKNEELPTLPARDAKGRFMARVVVVLSYCEELGDIVTTHLGVKAARQAVSLHKAIFPHGISEVC